MNKINIAILLIVNALLLSGCAHNTHKVLGPTSDAEIPAGVPVAIGGKEVSEGTRVNVFQSKCRDEQRTRSGTTRQCTLVKAGEATVLKVLGENLAIVQPDPGTVITEKMTIEKQ